MSHDHEFEGREFDPYRWNLTGFKYSKRTDPSSLSLIFWGPELADAYTPGRLSYTLVMPSKLLARSLSTGNRYSNGIRHRQG